MALKGKQDVIFSIMINAGLPFLTYRILSNHISNVTALIIAALIPFAVSIWSLIRTKKIDAFATFILVGLVLGILAAIIGGDEKFILLRNSIVTGIMGGVFIVSFLFPKPLIYYFALRFSDDKEEAATHWKYPNYRRVMRLMTFVWGMCLLLEAVVKVMLVYTLSVSQFLIVAPIFTYVIIGLTIFWTIKYTSKARKKFG